MLFGSSCQKQRNCVPKQNSGIPASWTENASINDDMVIFARAKKIIAFVHEVFCDEKEREAPRVKRTTNKPQVRRAQDVNDNRQSVGRFIHIHPSINQSINIICKQVGNDSNHLLTLKFCQRKKQFPFPSMCKNHTKPLVYTWKSSLPFC